MFRKELPKIYELRDQIKEPESPNSCFQNLDVILQNIDALKAWSILENALLALDKPGWEFLKEEISPYLCKRHKKRGREQLLNLINQAKAYTYLTNIGCYDIRFVPESDIDGVESPDLEGFLDSKKVICEVKTINPSDDEIARRKEGKFRHNEPQIELSAGFFNKLITTLNKAKSQIETIDTQNEAIHFVYFILYFDDFWCENKEGYYEQIDHYFALNPLNNIRIVFHNQSNCLDRTIKINMMYCEVHNES